MTVEPVDVRYCWPGVGDCRMPGRGPLAWPEYVFRFALGFRSCSGLECFFECWGFGDAWVSNIWEMRNRLSAVLVQVWGHLWNWNLLLVMEVYGTVITKRSKFVKKKSNSVSADCSPCCHFEFKLSNENIIFLETVYFQPLSFHIWWSFNKQSKLLILPPDPEFADKCAIFRYQ